MMFEFISIMVLAVVSLITCFYSKNEKTNKEELLKVILLHTPNYLVSNKDEIRKLGRNLQKLHALIEKDNIDYNQYSYVLKDLGIIESGIRNLDHFTKEDKKIVRRNINSYISEFNKKISIN